MTGNSEATGISLEAPPFRGLKAKPEVEDIALLIPTLGRPILKRCLFNIAAGECWPAHLIVVEQGENPRVCDWIQALAGLGLEVVHIRSDRRGRAAGINLGLGKVQTEFVVITDDDCIVEESWLSRMSWHLRKRPGAIITGRVEPAGGGEVEFSAVTSMIPKTYTRPTVRATPLIGGNMGVAMASVRKVGLFDEHPCIGAAEDNDWGYRALRAGVPIHYIPEIAVHHFDWRDAKQREERYRQYSRSQGCFYGKHLLSADPVIAIQVVRALLRAPIRWLRGWIRNDRDMRDRGNAVMTQLPSGILEGVRIRLQP